MSVRQFFGQFLLLSLLLAFAIGSLPSLLPSLIPAYIEFAWWAQLFFAALCVAIFSIGKKTASSPNKNAFTGVIMSTLFFKMLVAACLILVFNKQSQPTSTLFLLPFFLTYLGYTIFETSFMIKLGKSDQLAPLK